MSELKNKAIRLRELPASKEDYETGFYIEVVPLEVAEAEIAHLTDLLKRVCEQGYGYETKMEGKVEQFREFLFSHALGILGSGLKDKFVEIFGEEKIEITCQLCGRVFKREPPTNLFWGLICPKCLEEGCKVG